MNYVRLGKSGLEVSRICLGGNSWGAAGRRSWAPFDADASAPFFRRALDLGINFFDTADVYNVGASETILGEKLIGQVPRDDLVITTKFGQSMSQIPNAAGLGRKHMMASIDASLRRLRTDHVDIYMVHRMDPVTPVEEVMSGLADIVQAGKARYLGASVMRPTQFARLQLFARANGLPAFIAMQNLWSLLYREDERDMVPFCREEGVGLTPYSPLARGVLAGPRATERAEKDVRAHPYRTEASLRIVGRVVAVAAARGVKPAQVALAWLMHQQGLAAPVVGTTRLDQLDDAAAAVTVSLAADEIASLEAPYLPRAVM
jgi:aryl-alcohol dehydrogenase (NADP+)